MINIKKNDEIVLSDPSGKPLLHENGSNLWVVVDLDGNKVVATPVNGKNRQTFHKSRVLEHNGKKTDALAMAEKQSILTNKLKPNKSAQKKVIKRPSDKKGQPVPLDLKEVLKDGSELYGKPIRGFDHPGIEVISYCLIAPDKKSYKCFQTYDGSLGRKSGKSIPKKRYDIKDRDGGHVKFVEQLLNKKGYKQIGV